MKLKAEYVAGGALLVVAAGVALLATRTAGPVPMTKYTELRSGPLQEHLVTVDELNMSYTFSRPRFPVRYPAAVAGGLTQLVSKGFAPLWVAPDPQVAAMPAEKAWG